MFLRRVFSAGQAAEGWPFSAWKIAVCAWVSYALFAVLGGWRRIDPTEWLMVAPLAFGAFVFCGGAIAARMARISLDDALVYWMPWIAAAALSAPLAEGARRALSVSFGKSAVPFGAAAILVVFAIAIGVWVYHHTKKPWRGMVASLALLAAWGIMLAFPTVVAWFGRPAGASFFSWSAIEVSRAAVLFSMDGYWWTDARARFFGAGSEVEISGIFLRGAWAFLACAWMALGFAWSKRRSACLAFACASNVHRATFFLAWGFAFAWMRGAMFEWRFVNAIAFLVMATTAAVFFAAHAMRKDQEETSSLFFALGFAGAWLLGWPVFLLAVAGAMLPALARMAEIRARWQPWSLAAQDGCAAAISAAAAWVAATRLSDFASLPAALVLAILLASRAAFVFSLLIAAATVFAWQRKTRRPWEMSIWFYVFFAVALAFAAPLSR